MAVENMNKPIFLLLGLLTACGAAIAEDSGYIGGLEPDTRPAGAPVINQFEQTASWKTEALRGIDPPPTGVEFLKDQGAWYTPFNYRNMPVPYDIRGLYQASSPGKE